MDDGQKEQSAMEQEGAFPTESRQEYELPDDFADVPTLADEVNSIVRRYEREASKRRFLDSLSNDYGQGDPYEHLAVDLKRTREVIDREVERLAFLSTHQCEYDEHDFCAHCGRDGRA
jgi:hypothetical protein